MEKVAIVLDDKTLLELQTILLDGDEQAALCFLKKVIWEQVEAARRKGMHNHLDRGQR